jgi:cytochrome c oxidase subunit 4
VAFANAEEARKHRNIYLFVFAALAVLTIVTVAVSYLHLPILWAVVVALIVACTKGGLVACYFMHLISEKQIIYWVLILCVVFFAVMLAIPLLTEGETSTWLENVS